MKTFKTLLLATALLAGIAGGEAQAGTLTPNIAIPLLHNGSRMTATLQNNSLSIVYAEPKASLAEAGVKAGDELASLTSKGSGQWSGQARVFKSGCVPAIYSIMGTTVGEVLVLEAREGPVWIKGAVEWDRCHWKMSTESKHLNLKFSAISEAELARLDPNSDEAKAVVYANSWDGQQEAYRKQVRADLEAKKEAERQESIRRQQAALEDQLLKGTQPVAETVERNDTRLPETPAVAAVVAEPVAVEEAKAERALYSDPKFLKEVGSTGAPLVSSEEQAKEAKPEPVKAEPAPTPVQAEAKPELVKPKLDIDF
ncbi:hypothetical protein [Aureimonas psammosilenae]|uniref:hypothetical protein n=1 Tax=Aureimonas psammosilenae TaxID=2495496 RepID=UPI00126112A9|nr:hypothetical protein [Aureimonas psammosilenae]